MSCDRVLVRTLGLVDYQDTWDAMRRFTSARDASNNDEIWLLEHAPVFTQGQAGKPEHLISPGDIPVVKTDRGGQVTYHGPGQLIMYFMIDLKRRGLGIRDMVSLLENAVIKMLAENNVKALARKDAPGVYVDDAKVASLGLRVSRSCTYHGLSVNVDMDLEPFSRINPCGLTDISVAQLSGLFDMDVDLMETAELLVATICKLMGCEFENRGNERSDIS